MTEITMATMFGIVGLAIIALNYRISLLKGGNKTK